MRSMRLGEAAAFKAGPGLAVIIYALPQCPACGLLTSALEQAVAHMVRPVRTALVTVDAVGVALMRQTAGVQRYPACQVLRDGQQVMLMQGFHTTNREVLGQELLAMLQRAASGEGSLMDAWRAPEAPASQA